MDRSARWVILAIILLTALVATLVWWMDTHPETSFEHLGHAARLEVFAPGLAGQGWS